MTGNETERRVLRIRDLRVARDAGEQRIEGYAAIFGELSEDLGGFVETIQRGAFARTVREDDVRALWNHDPNYVLGRTKSGTLRLSEDDRGLWFSVRPPGATWARDVLATIRRRDVDQMSFGFETVRDRWIQAEGLAQRTLLEVRLFDVAPVTFPAYPQTSAEVRAKAEQLAQRWGLPGLAPGRVDVARRRVELERLAKR